MLYSSPHSNPIPKRQPFILFFLLIFFKNKILAFTSKFLNNMPIG